jgi:hypothetical protein
MPTISPRNEHESTKPLASPRRRRASTIAAAYPTPATTWAMTGPQPKGEPRRTIAELEQSPSTAISVAPTEMTRAFARRRASSIRSTTSSR